MQFLENFQFSWRGFADVCNFKLLSVVKKFWKNCGETLKYRSQYSEVFGELLEQVWKNFAIVFRKIGKNLQECKRYKNLGNTWKNIEKIYENL